MYETAIYYVFITNLLAAYFTDRFLIFQSMYMENFNIVEFINTEMPHPTD